MPDYENINPQEVSGEIIKDWYKEKGLSPEEESKEEEPERETPSREKEERKEEPPSGFTTSLPEEKPKDPREAEEEKKLAVKNKVRELLSIAEEKGLERSIKEAQKENDPFLLDVYHDVLAKDAAYKNFLNK